MELLEKIITNVFNNNKGSSKSLIENKMIESS